MQFHRQNQGSHANKDKNQIHDRRKKSTGIIIIEWKEKQLDNLKKNYR